MRLTAGRRACRKPDKCWRPGQRTAAVIAVIPTSLVFVSFFLALKYTLELSDCSVGRRQVDSDISHFTSLRRFVEYPRKRCRLQDRSRRIWQEDMTNSRKTRSVRERRLPSRQIWCGSGSRLWITSKFNGDFHTYTQTDRRTDAAETVYHAACQVIKRENMQRREHENQTGLLQWLFNISLKAALKLTMG